MKRVFLAMVILFAGMCAPLSAQNALPPPPDDRPGDGGPRGDAPFHGPGMHKPGGGWKGEHGPGMPPHNSSKGNEMLVIMSKLKKENPGEYERLSELRKTDFPAFIAEIKKYLPAPSGTWKKIGQLGHECSELANKIREVQNPEEKAALEATLRTKIKEGFDYMLQDYAERLQRMTQQLEALKENEATILEERFKMYMTPKPAAPERP